MSTVGIVGAGPSGIMAALQAAERGARVILFDSNRTVGRKLAVTGNGRGNLTNAAVGVDAYHCADRSFLERALSAFGRDDLLTYLRRVGVLTYATHDGWYYPVSGSAATVVEALATALDAAGVEVRLLTKVDDLRPRGAGWELWAGGGSSKIPVDRVVVATGGMAAPALGSKGSMFPVLEGLGHTVIPLRPALVPLVGDVRHLHKLQGVRLDVRVRLLAGDEVLGEEFGNLMFTQSGLSGPAPMNLSYLVGSDGRKGLEASIDLVPTHRHELMQLLHEQQGRPVPLRVLLGSVVPPKVPPVIMELAGVPREARLTEVDGEALARVLGHLRDLRVRVTGTRGFDQAQLSAGGVPVTEVDADTMESRKARGLHLAGEVMDVVGPCGGFNLQFAFTSGALAGRAAAG
ncbi:MAG: aminoacetone oxidase family FAD-binding enzyme [Anaerolineae bacterium]|nr:aminoacetone oxidase family FAD-binding enzyme [Anaerolineae bacterium]